MRNPLRMICEPSPSAKGHGQPDAAALGRRLALPNAPLAPRPRKKSSLDNRGAARKIRAFLTLRTILVVGEGVITVPPNCNRTGRNRSRAHVQGVEPVMVRNPFQMCESRRSAA